jgi:hypothetical protein
MVKMKSKSLKKVAILVTIFFLAMTAVPACKQEIQAIPIDRDQYSIEEGVMTISLNGVDELSKIGGWINIEKNIPTGGESGMVHFTILVACTGKDQYVIASRKNHKGWWLTFDAEKNLLVSSDGRREFRLDGSAMGDKPKQPLTIHEYTLRDGNLLIELGKHS